MSHDPRIRHLEPADMTLIGEIDRSENVGLAYVVDEGELVSRPVDWDVPTFDPVGAGDHSVRRLIDTWSPVVDGGADLLGAFEIDQLLGLAIVDPVFEADMAWLCLLHVSRAYRRRGVATALWDEAVRLAAGSGAASIYVSATASGSAVGFYVSRGCRLANQPHPRLLAKEPEDVHLICPIT